MLDHDWEGATGGRGGGARRVLRRAAIDELLRGAQLAQAVLGLAPRVGEAGFLVREEREERGLLGEKRGHETLAERRHRAAASEHRDGIEEASVQHELVRVQRDLQPATSARRVSPPRTSATASRTNSDGKEGGGAGRAAGRSDAWAAA